MPQPDDTVSVPASDAAGSPEPPIAGGPEASADEAPERSGIVDAVADFIRMFVEYVRQETGDVVHDKVVVPTQKAGQVVAFALAAAMVLFLGVTFISVAALLVLAGYIGWPAALLVVGGVLVLGAGGLTYLKTRSLQ